jgi:hypothetical protein
MWGYLYFNAKANKCVAVVPLLVNISRLQPSNSFSLFFAKSKYSPCDEIHPESIAL